MHWVIPALSAPLIYTCTNFVDKYIVAKEVKDYRGMPLYGAIMGLIMGIIFFIAAGFPILNLRDTLVLLLTGSLTIWGSALYFKAISFDDPSRLIILFQSTPILVLLMSYLFLEETITNLQLIGFLIILSSVVGASDNFSKKGFQISKSFWLIFLCNFFWAISTILIKFVINQNSFVEVLSYESWGLGLGGFILYIFFPKIRGSFNDSITTIRKKALAIMFGNEVLFTAGKSSSFLALSMGSTALVSIIGSTQVFFGVFLGLILTLFAPHIVKEDISKRALSKKFAFSILVFIGLILVSLN